VCKSVLSGKPEDDAKLSHLNHLVQGRSMCIGTAEDATPFLSA
jgi:hypothetical protein